MTGDIQTGCTVREMVSFTQDGKYRQINRMCQFKRTPPWDGTLSDLYDEIKIKYNAIVEWTNEDDVRKTAESLKGQIIQPSQLIIICYQKMGGAAFNFAKGCGLPWKITEIVQDLEDWRDDIINKNPAQFYMFIRAGYTLLPNYMSDLNDQIHFNDLRFGSIKSDNLLIVPHGLYTMVVSPLRKIIEEMPATGLNTLNENFSTAK